MTEWKPPEDDRPDKSSLPPMPVWPESEDDAVPITEKPTTVRVAVILMYVGAALSALVPLSAFGSRSQLRPAAEQALRAQGRPAGAEEVEALTNAMLTSIVVFGLIMVAVWVFMAVMNGRGKPWARATASVLAVLNVFFNILGLSWLGLALIVVGVVSAALLWVPASRPWFESARRISV
ncbi:hypothetical protein [Thermasporomyces composti]|jgi:hypothetical protein|uniref:Uncharacterized protein n=1 Tax=Thermasporomyces composti TaxID=696763 RepID=A0A3D9V5X8_THECX|nr:hypothetical protein [Thermasporomyces composti]REF36103.1 hypothetical protein DFJ64_1501 [Thermasporomyces composti]